MINKCFYFILIAKVLYWVDFTYEQSITTETNYTLSYFQSYDLSKAIKCTSDLNCPLYTKCSNYTDTATENSKTFNICRFENFLCADNDEPCLYINSTLWNIHDERATSNSTSSIIIKTCPRNQVSNESPFSSTNNKKKKKPIVQCRTEKCNSGEDCLSGKCLYERCVYDTESKRLIYMCSGILFQDELVRCGRASGMPASEESMCFSKAMKQTYCLSYGDEDDTMLVLIITACVIAGMFVLVMSLTGCYLFVWPRIKDAYERLKESRNHEKEEWVDKVDT